MRGIAASIAVLWWIVGYAPNAGAEEKQLSLQAQELKSSLAALKEKPRDKTAQIRYLRTFPKDIKAFQRLFNPPDFSELYDGADYIFALRNLAQDQTEPVGKLLLGLSKDAPQGADALSYLQHTTAEYAVKNTAIFAKLLNQYSEKDADKVIGYLADVENHHAYLEYPLIIENLRKIGETKLADRFEAAKIKRMQKPTHEKKNENRAKHELM